MSHLFPTYLRWELEPVSAKGANITGKDGLEYLDFTSGIGVCNLGHRPEVVETAVLAQLQKYWHVSNLFIQEQQEKAAEYLAKGAGLDRVFFSNSGAEANEGAIKLARKATGRSKIITLTQSFHGRTFATMSATGQDKVKNGYGPLLETFIHVPLNDKAALQEVLDEDVAAVMLEIVQGEGGVYIAQMEYLKEVELLCSQVGALLVIDEIQTGIGRTGKPFAFQHFGIKPDIVTSAKGLGSGFPIGAVIGKEELIEYFGAGSHGSTFGGNPISIVAAIATMETIFNKAFLQDVLEKGEYLNLLLQTSISKHQQVKEVRGLGLMVGIEFTEVFPDLLGKLRKNGLIALPAGDRVLRMLPPLNVNKQEMKQAVDILSKTIQESLISVK